MSVHRTGIFAYGKPEAVFKSDHIGLGHVDHGADDGKLGPIQVGDRREAVAAPLIKKGHEKRFDHIVPVMGVGNYIASHGLCLLVQGTFAHFGAERAGICLFFDVKKDLADLRRYKGPGNAEFPAERLYRLHLHISKAEVHSDGRKRIFLRIKPLEMMEGI